ncbi:MAG: tetratricopeptide repeat protein [Verrucomicrobia bacterium]|nr:tetratricopeptide repeat protein [Verrucomicrobiota bacterium]MDA1006017.1 tetratricopeptide repeat protein [Verrucomicrobiota bacterium]
MSQSKADNQSASTAEARRAGGELARMMAEGRAFSGHERNRCFLNTGAGPAGGLRFANVSACSGLDFPDDGRAVALVDWDQDGDLDLWISNRNAPRLRLMRNDSPGGNHVLALQLQGKGGKTNRDAIGARVEVITGNPAAADRPKTIKTLRAGEGFLSQSSKWLHFGLGAAEGIEKVVVHWPGGEAEEFTGLGVDRRYRLVQGSGAGKDLTLPARETRLAPAVQEVPDPSEVARIPMVEWLSVPACDYVGFDGQPRPLPAGKGSWLLVNLWASWCAPCLVELDEFSRHHGELRAKGLEVLALSVDGLTPDSADAAAAAADLVSGRKFPFTVGRATPLVAETFQGLADLQFPLHQSLPLPASFLLDPKGRLAVIYKGPVSVATLLGDVGTPEGSGRERLARSAPIPGLPIPHPRIEKIAAERAVALRLQLGADLLQAGDPASAASQFTDLLEIMPDFAKVRGNLAVSLQRMGRSEEAAVQFQEALRLDPNFAEGHLNWAVALLQQGRFEEAVHHCGEALRIKPDLADAQLTLARSLRSMRRIGEALQHYRETVRLNPGEAEAYNEMGALLGDQGQLAEAVTCFENAVRLNPGNENAANNLRTARALLQQRGGPPAP